MFTKLIRTTATGNTVSIEERNKGTCLSLPPREKGQKGWLVNMSPNPNYRGTGDGRDLLAAQERMKRRGREAYTAKAIRSRAYGGEDEDLREEGEISENGTTNAVLERRTRKEKVNDWLKENKYKFTLPSTGANEWDDSSSSEHDKGTEDDEEETEGSEHEQGEKETLDEEAGEVRQDGKGLGRGKQTEEWPPKEDGQRMRYRMMKYRGFLFHDSSGISFPRL
jgi:hypothetical protein